MKKYVPLIAVLIALTACTDTAQTDNAETTIKVKVTETGYALTFPDLILMIRLRKDTQYSAAAADLSGLPL